MISGFIFFSIPTISFLFSGARHVFFPFFSSTMVSYGIFRVNLFLSFNKVIFFISAILIDFDLKSFTLSIPSVILYSVLYMRMHDESAIKMKQAINGIRLSTFFSDNKINIRHNTIAVTEYIIDIHTQPLAFSDIRELKVFIVPYVLMCF